MAIGIPAIALFGYLYFVPWQRFRRAVSDSGWSRAEEGIRRVRRSRP